MKTRIIFGILLIVSISWIGYSLWLVDKNQHTLSFDSFFSDKQPLYIVNRADGCLPDNAIIQLNTFNISEYIANPTTFNYWKSISYQVDETGQLIRLLLEEKTVLKDEYLTQFLQSIALYNEKGISHLPQEINNFYICRTNGLLAISSSPFSNSNDANEMFVQRIKNRDKQASYSVILADKTMETYCSQESNKHYHTLNTATTLHAEAVSDLDMYSILPTFTQSFYFVEKFTLFSQANEWDDESIKNYIDRGLIYAQIDGETVVFIDIIGQFVPQEIMTEFAQDKSTISSQIIALNRSIGTVELPYATGIENTLILSEDKDILERIRLAYQMGDLFNKTETFNAIRNEGAQKVHFRWYAPSGLSFAITNPFVTSHLGYGIFRNNQKQLILAYSETPSNTSLSNNKPEQKSGSISWNFALENKNSQFFLNEKNVCVYNPDKKTVSIVDEKGKVATWIQLTDNLKTIHPMDGGFLIEQFNQLIWLADTSPFEKKEIPFKGAIASTIAPYIWKGVPSISLISENKLYRISLKTGNSETTSIPADNSISKGQLHAFNHEGDLSFGVFIDSTFHLFNSKKNKWNTTVLNHAVVWSKKINGKVHYLAKNNQGFVYQELFKPSNAQLILTEHNYFSAFHTNTSTLFTFHVNNSVEIYSTTEKTKFTFSIANTKPEMITPILDRNKLSGMISLDGIQNVMEVCFLNNSTNVSKNVYNASQFIKFVETNKVITFVDGQLVMYNL